MMKSKWAQPLHSDVQLIGYWPIMVSFDVLNRPTRFYSA